MNALHHILVVDDEAPTRWGLSLILESVGYRVSEATNGRQALAIILAAKKEMTPFDLLILDIQLPLMTGLELLDAIRNRALTLPVLVITGYSDEDTAAKLRLQGCKACLDKPFKPDELLDHVKGVLEHPSRGQKANPSNTGEQSMERKGGCNSI